MEEEAHRPRWRIVLFGALHKGRARRAGYSRSTTDFILATHLFHLPSLAMSTAPEQVTLVTSDNVPFKVDKDVAERSVLIKNMLEGL